MKSRIVVTSVITIYTFFISLAYSLGAFWLSDGWGRISKSPHYVFLYNVQYWVVPGLIAIFIVNLVACFVSRKVFIRSLLIAFFCGFVGPLIIHILVLIESEPEAGMAYIFILHAYGVVFLLALIASSIFVTVKSKRDRKVFQETNVLGETNRTHDDIP